MATRISSIYETEEIIMRFTRRLAALSAAAAICPVFIAESSARAMDPPTDVHLIMETKEIAIEDIPDDRIVRLTVALENCPPYNTLCFGVKKDPRLSFYPTDECFSMAEGVVQASPPDCLWYDNEPDYRYCGTGASGDDMQRVSYERDIVVVSFRLPDEVSPGDFFPVELPSEYRNEKVMLSLSQSLSDCWEVFPFTQLNGGGIRITQRDQPTPPPPTPTNAVSGGGNSQGGAGQGNSGGGGGQPSGGGNAPAPSDGGGENIPAPAEVTAVQTATAATSAETTASTSKNTTSKTTSTMSTTTEKTTITTASSKSTSAVITTGAEEEPEKKNTGGLKTIAVITLIVAAVSSLAVLGARLRMNRK